MRRRPGTLWRYALTAVLGLPPRPVAAPRAARRAASSYDAPAEAVNALQFSRAYWLPPFGRGNGLDALFWAPLAQVPERRVDAALRAFAAQGIAGWAARDRTAGTPAGTHDLWVESGRLEESGDLLMAVCATPSEAVGR